MNPETEAQIRARAEAARAGPWEWRGDPHEWNYDLGHLNADGSSGAVVFADACECEYCSGENPPLQVSAANAEFIAHARTDVPDLLDRVRFLEDALGTANARADYLSDELTLAEGDARAEVDRLRSLLTELTAFNERQFEHVRVSGSAYGGIPGHDFCRGCGGEWPCPTVKSRAWLDRLDVQGDTT